MYLAQCDLLCSVITRRPYLLHHYNFDLLIRYINKSEISITLLVIYHVPYLYLHTLLAPCRRCHCNFNWLDE